MNILVINSGSSSIKYELFDMDSEVDLMSGQLSRIGESDSRLRHRAREEDGTVWETASEVSVRDHQEGFERILAAVEESGGLGAHGGVAAIGHRVVHGGRTFQAPAFIDRSVLDELRALIPLAPLHNPANLSGIEVCMALFPDVRQVAVFDTAYHHTLPAHASRYAVPEPWYREHGVRRFGFHGTSHRFVAGQAAAHMGKALNEVNLITLHLGNGASATAVRAGKSVDTSMGMTPLEGLVMGTRSGDIDPAIPAYIHREVGVSFDDIDQQLNHDSGLKGVCGVNDMREVLRRADGGDERAALALEMYCYRIQKYIGAYCAVLGRVDGIVFTAGIGENAAKVRERICIGLEHLGIRLDVERNAAAAGDIFAIHGPDSSVQLLVVRTHEELEIARQTLAFIED